MDIKEVKEKKAELEKMISTAIYRFEGETGCKVEHINLIPLRTFGGTHEPSVVVIDVEVK